ncbi:MAG TPA: hypothetical protein VD769_06200 [Gaiellaceae bacterium]|nr:hypothetical protein [Gaiellaceae bacterium]
MTNGRDLGRTSYAVIWRSGDGPVRPGKLVLGPKSFHLETGKPGGRISAERIRYADLASVEKAPPAERLHGRPTTVVRRTEREPLSISAMDGLGSAHEIVERLARSLPSRGAA